MLNIALGDGKKLYIKEEDAVNLSKVVDKNVIGAKLINSNNLNYFVENYNINFVKMDAEGYEYDIFGKGNINKNINKIAMEFHTRVMGTSKSNSLIKNLYRNGFYAHRLIEDLPLRLYPFRKLFLRLLTWVKKDLSEKEVLKEIHLGRGVKYLYLVRGGKNERI